MWPRIRYMSDMRILIIEDDRDIAELIRYNLAQEDFTPEVSSARTCSMDLTL